jgi:Fe-S-cluster containining protein
MDEVLAQAVRQLRAARAKITVDFRLKVLKEGRVSCRKGCSNCCHYPVYVSLLEGILIYQGLHDDRLWTNKLKAKFQEAARNTWGQSIAVWMLSNRPCPLLGDDGLCRSYDNRPVHCRVTFSRGSPHDCHPHRFQANTLVPRPETSEVSVVERRLLKQLGASNVLLPLAAAVLLGERVSDGVHVKDLVQELPW